MPYSVPGAPCADFSSALEGFSPCRPRFRAARARRGAVFTVGEKQRFLRPSYRHWSRRDRDRNGVIETTHTRLMIAQTPHAIVGLKSSARRTSFLAAGVMCFDGLISASFLVIRCYGTAEIVAMHVGKPSGELRTMLTSADTFSSALSTCGSGFGRDTTACGGSRCWFMACRWASPFRRRELYRVAPRVERSWSRQPRGYRPGRTWADPRPQQRPPGGARGGRTRWGQKRKKRLMVAAAFSGGRRSARHSGGRARSLGLTPHPSHIGL